MPHGIYQGVAVDTHVKRLSQRLGLTGNKNPDKIEQDLHGRAICEAKKPKCNKCFLNKFCPSAFDFPHFKK